MRSRLLAILLLVTSHAGALAQFGSFSDVPIEINADQNRFENNLAIAQENVVIRYGEILIYCDYAQFDRDTRDVLVQGNVRIYREGRLIVRERALYNLETKVLSAADFRGDFTPFRFAGDSLGTLGANAYIVKNGAFTTSDNSKPDYHLSAKTIRIYPNDRVIFSDVTLYIGRTPVFWFPYLYQSLEKEQSFSLAPGYTGVWGAYLLSSYTFPITENWSGRIRLDVLSKRGVGLGFESLWGARETGRRGTTSDADRKGAGEADRNWGRFRAYHINDQSPDVNKTSLTREAIDPGRYRVSFQNRTYVTEDIYATIDINKLSDARYLQDFEQGEFRRNPNPDNSISLTKWDENYTATLTGRKNLNERDFDATERLPEIALDFKRQPFFGTSLYYEGETSAGYLRRNFAEDSLLTDYDTSRADTFHQLTLPMMLGGWFSLIPRVGVRGTYYGRTGEYEEVIRTFTLAPELPGADPREVTTRRQELREGGARFRAVANAGFEASFKFSKPYEHVQSREWGLDGLRHVVQPFLNFSAVYTNLEASEILQFDRLNRSTQRPPIDFPQFNSIDSIDNWTILRLGVRNRWQTRRDNRTINWLEWNTFFDINFDEPGFAGGVIADAGTFSNIYSRVRWNPLPWVSLNIDSQLPLLDSGFTEINSNLNFMVSPNVLLSLGHRFIDGNVFFPDSNLVDFGGYVRFDENWAFSFRESYEVQDSTLESQHYELHRDLSSWVASLGFVVRDNRGVNDYGLLLTFSLKDIPNVRLPISLDPGDLSGSSGKNR